MGSFVSKQVPCAVPQSRFLLAPGFPCAWISTFFLGFCWLYARRGCNPYMAFAGRAFPVKRDAARTEDLKHPFVPFRRNRDLSPIMHVPTRNVVCEPACQTGKRRSKSVSLGLFQGLLSCMAFCWLHMSFTIGLISCTCLCFLCGHGMLGCMLGDAEAAQIVRGSLHGPVGLPSGLRLCSPSPPTHPNIFYIDMYPFGRSGCFIAARISLGCFFGWAEATLDQQFLGANCQVSFLPFVFLWEDVAAAGRLDGAEWDGVVGRGSRTKGVEEAVGGGHIFLFKGCLPCQGE